MSEDYERPLRIANGKHDIVAIHILDPRETELPDVGYLELEDAETGEQILLDTSDANFRKMYKEGAADTMTARDKMFKSMNVDSIVIRTDQSYFEPLMRFFRMRAKRFR